MDALTKRALRHISLKTAKETLDVPRISLQLLSSVGKLDFPTERLRRQWQKRQASSYNRFYLQYASMGVCLTIVSDSAIQANVLEELLLFSASLEYDMSKTLRIVLSKLKSTEASTSNDTSIYLKNKQLFHLSLRNGLIHSIDFIVYMHH